VTPLLTLVALIAFASNSILCRLALAGHEIDPANFTLVRLASGGLTLLLIHAIVTRSWTGGSLAGHAPNARPLGRVLIAAALLFLYALPFSIAYVSIGAATGALILFTAVQATMLLGALRSGERFHPLEGVGLVIAIGGLIYLVFPGLSAPSPVGCALMVVAGIAWGLYSLRGRGSRDPLRDTTNNFVWTLPLAIAARWAPAAIAGPLGFAHTPATGQGMLLAIASGALASGLGYTIWFAAMRGLTAIRASMVQLASPVLAAVGGILLLGEPVTPRLVVSAALILGGLGIALMGRAQTSSVREPRTITNP
jgi:drug/metabolite transporter (DMT)-like permease